MALSYWDRSYVQMVYQNLLYAIGNDYGVAGLMGNLYAESGICPFRCQGDFSTNYVNSYNVTINTLRTLSSYDFQHYVYGGNPANQGYSLAQWTTYSRKANYYDFCGQSLLGDGQKSIEFLIYELQTSYSSVWNVLVNAGSIREASNKVLHDFESPADQSEAVEILRASYGTDIYNDFSGLPPIPPGPTTDINKILLSRWIRKRRHELI